MSYEIIDFHTHPFVDKYTNICKHLEYCDMSVETTVAYFKSLGISQICGSVLCRNTPEHAVYENEWEMIKASNETALALRERYGEFYIPGFHIHPGYLKESCDEIEKMSKKGVRLIGELCPYIYGWRNKLTDQYLDEILDVAASYHMIVNIHSDDNCAEEMDEMVRRHPKTVIVAAHPGDTKRYLRHLERMKLSDNYYLDLSAGGINRFGMLRQGIAEFGAERFIFGSDYPVCSPATILGGVLLDTMLTETEKRLILSENAKRLLI